MNAVVASLIRRIQVGAGTQFHGLTILPLYDEDFRRPQYISLKAGLLEKVVEITEVSESGAVNALKVVNSGALPVLLLDGEELKGAKQNRIVNTSMLAAAHAETQIPVSCTEQGRWTYNSPAFNESGNLLPAISRAARNCRILESGFSGKRNRAEQGQIWQELRDYHRRLGTYSGSGALLDAYAQKSRELNAITGAFPLEPGQQGMVAVLNGVAVSADFLASPAIYADLHGKLLRSVAIEALLQPVIPTHKGDDTITACQFLHSLESAVEQSFASPGLGEDLRYNGPGTGGAALYWQEEVIHLHWYPKSSSNRGGKGPVLAPEAPGANQFRRRSWRS